jgi:hypothetical protein
MFLFPGTNISTILFSSMLVFWLPDRAVVSGKVSLVETPIFVPKDISAAVTAFSTSSSSSSPSEMVGL